MITRAFPTSHSRVFFPCRPHARSHTLTLLNEEMRAISHLLCTLRCMCTSISTAKWCAVVLQWYFDHRLQLVLFLLIAPASVLQSGVQHLRKGNVFAEFTRKYCANSLCL